MKIDSLKQLKELMKLCQSHGVENIEVDGIKMEIRPVVKAIKRSNRPIQPTFSSGIEDVKVPTPNIFRKPMNDVSDHVETPDELTEEQLLNWSAAPAVGQ